MVLSRLSLNTCKSCLRVVIFGRNMGYNLTAEMFSEWAIGLVVIAVRLYTRFSVDRGMFRWDDVCLVLGTVGF